MMLFKKFPSPCILPHYVPKGWPLRSGLKLPAPINLVQDAISCLSMPYVPSALAWRINEREHKCPVLEQEQLIEGETLFSWLD